MSRADGSGQEEGAAAPAVAGRQLLRSQIFKALADRDLDLALLLATRLSRMLPLHADDLIVAAAVRANRGERDQARQLLIQALATDPYHALAAKTLVNASGPDGTLPGEVLSALRWNAETDPEAVRALEAVASTGRQPQAFVAARQVQCVVPPGEWLVTLRWRHLTLTQCRLGPGNGVRRVTLTLPGALRGVIDPVVNINNTDLPPGAIPADWLAPPRLSARVRAEGPRRWQVQAVDEACPTRPVALLLRNGERVLSRHVVPATMGLFDLDPADAPAVAIDLPPDAAHPNLTFELTGEPASAPPAPAPDDGVVDVIVPVYGDFDATRACLAALLDMAPGTPMRVVAIDDAGPDDRIAHLLDGLATAGRITLIRNPGNLGFVRSVNIGMALHSGRDVVLLNADTVVTADWLGRLRSAARRAPDTGTVTPWSNDATICSYPVANGPTPLPDVDVAAMDGFAATCLTGQTADLPTAVGFCMYIRRDCLAATGWFDARAFGTGYGEENDFCYRAAAIGWRHRMALDLYVGHVGSASFSTQRQARVATALNRLESRHPGYQADIQAFIAADPLRHARRNLDLVRLRAAGGTYPLLVVCAQLGGGTDRFITDKLKSRRIDAGGALILRPEQPEDSPARLRLEVPDRPDLPNLIYDVATQTGTLLADLRHLGVASAEFHHPSRLPPPLLPVLASWFPYRVHIHDYGWICPRINLLTGNDRYCGEPDARQCDVCVRAHGDLLGIDRPVAAWRDLTRQILEAAQTVDCSCHDTANRMRRYAPRAHFQITPAEPSPPARQAGNAPLLRSGEALRIVVPGAIGPPKGYQLLLDCARDAAHRNLPLRYLVMGYSMDDDALAATGRVLVTGQYAEGEAPALLADLRPHAAFLPSVWPETWCYALSHVMAAGLPVAAFALGAQAERLRAAGHGLLLPADMAPTAINDALLATFGRPASVQ